MQILKKNLKAGEVVVKPENNEDLWYLRQLIARNNEVSGKTERKIKLGGDEDRKQTVIKKTIFLKILVEKTEFNLEGLRISGTVSEANEDVPKGSHHTLTVEPGDTLGIIKDEWMSFELEKLEEAKNSIKRKLLLVMFDREEAIFAVLKGNGHEVLSTLKGDVEKKRYSEAQKKSFYSEISEVLKEYDGRYSPEHIIIASPSFWKDYLLKEMPEDLKKKTIASSCSEVSEGNIREVMQRPELFKVLEKDRSSKEVSLIETLMVAISNEVACYGLKETEEKLSLGALKDLFVSYDFLNSEREKGSQLESLMKRAEKMGGKVNIISTELAMKKLSGLGGVAGILRWKS